MGFSPSDQRPDNEKQHQVQMDYQAANYGQSSDQPRRSGCLTLWLAGMLIAAFVALMSLLGIIQYGRIEMSASTNILIRIAAVVLLIQIASLVGIFNWQKWGVYLLAITLFVSPTLRFLLGTLSPQSLISVIFGFAMIFIFIRPNWRYYKGRDWIRFE